MLEYEKVDLDLTKASLPHDSRIVGNMVQNEASVQNIVHYVLLDILTTLRLNEKIRVVDEQPYCDLFFDHALVLKVNGCVKAAVEDKKAHSLSKAKSSTYKRYLGQCYDNLATLADVGGIEHPLGILTDYETWVFCWLVQSDSWMERCLGKKVKVVLEEWVDGSRREEEEEVSIMREAGVDNANAEEGEEVERKLSVATFKWNDKKLLQALLSFVVLSYVSNVSRKSLHPREQRSSIVMNEKDFVRKKVSLQVNFRLQWEMPPSFIRKFIIIKPLGKGSDGTVYKACDLSGRLCALKFLYRERGVRKSTEEDMSFMPRDRNPPSEDAADKVIIYLED